MPWRAIVIYKALIITNFIIKNQLSWEQLTISSNRTITFLSKFIHHISMYNRLDWIDAKTLVVIGALSKGFWKGLTGHWPLRDRCLMEFSQENLLCRSVCRGRGHVMYICADRHLDVWTDTTDCLRGFYWTSAPCK